MKSKKYSLLYFHHLCDKYSKWIFPLHEGENIIGSDKISDIFLYLNETEDYIESIHCKIFVDKNNNISIISLTDNGSVKLENDDIKKSLSPGKDYELKNKSIFYLGKNLKFMVIYDTLDEINNFFKGQRLENEFLKWKDLITYQEKKTKCNIIQQRKESLNKSNLSNASNNNNNVNNNNNINNSLLQSNKKEINPIAFNDFDQVPEDIWNNDNENSMNKNNLESPFKQINNQNQMQKNKLVKDSIDSTPKKSQDVNISENNNKNNIDVKDMMYFSKEQKIKNTFEENMFNNSKNISQENYDNYNNYHNNNLPLFQMPTTTDFVPLNNKYNETHNSNKDDKTAKMIRELLGENNLELIIKNTDLNKIKKLDTCYKKINKAKIESGIFDIKFNKKANILGKK